MNTHKDSVKAEVQVCKQPGTEPWVTVYELKPMQLSWAVRECRREMDWIKAGPAQYGNPRGIRSLINGQVYEHDLIDFEDQQSSGMDDMDQFEDRFIDSRDSGLPSVVL